MGNWLDTRFGQVTNLKQQNVFFYQKNLHLVQCYFRKLYIQLFVAVDTTAQYDAVRAYLKELDISSAVWVGLIRSNPDGDFTWT